MQILYRARIYTLDSSLPVASAIAFDAGRIVALGEDEEILSRFSGETTNAEGRIVLPGLTDSHLHLEHYALFLSRVDCETSTRQECLERVRQRAASTPPGEWVAGHGWNQNSWPEGFGSAADLDMVAPDHPVYLTAKSLHAGWANTRALQAASLTRSSADPAGGRLGRDAQGELDGILYESAMGLMETAIPIPGPAKLEQLIRDAQARLWSMGLTGIHDFDRKRCFMALQSLHQAGELHLRVVKSIPVEDLDHAAALGLRSGFGDDWLRIGPVKAFADGALGPQTAAMIQPYEGNPENRGMLMLDAEQLYEIGCKAVQSGLSLAVHAIGDRANHEVLNGYEALRSFEEAKGLPPLRHRIEHVQVLHPDDVSRLARLGVTASMQPIHATSDMLMADRHWGERSDLSYAWRAQLDQGAAVAFGSDAPVESPNPFWGLHAAVTRQRIDGSPGPEGWYPAQRLTVLEGLQGFTTGAAYAAGVEDHLGRLSPGYLADFILVDTDPFTCSPQEIANIRCLETWVGGQRVY